MRGVTVRRIAEDLAAEQFQLTRLMRGVTPQRQIQHGGHNHFNSHASCEA